MLYVVTPVFNPWGYERIPENFQRFAARMRATPGVQLVVVECAFSDRPWTLTDPANRFDVRVRSNSVLWIKENLINLGFQRIAQEAPEAQEIAWIDSDIDFLDEDWVNKTIAALDHYDVIQPWSDAVCLGPRNEMQGTLRSFMDHYIGGSKWKGYKTTYSLWHPGFAWAARRSTLDKLGGLLNISVVGTGDMQMAVSLIGRAEEGLEYEGVGAGILPEYSDAMMAWQERAKNIVAGNVGAIKGTIRHHWHGRYLERQYESRHAIPIAHGYNPHRDVVPNAYGVLELATHAHGLRDGVRRMFANRNDDANTVD